MASVGIEVRRAAIEKTWAASGHDDTWLLLRTKTPRLEGFSAAVDAANQLAEARGEDGDVFAEAPGCAPKGLTVLLSQASDRQALRRWVEDFRQQLEQAGLEGTLTGAVEARTPDWAESRGGPVHTAFLAFVLELDAMTADPQRTSHWHVDPERTQRIANLTTEWAHIDSAEVILRQNSFPVGLTPGATASVHIAAPLARAVSTTGRAGLQVIDQKERRAHHVALAPGVGVFQVIADHDGWQARLAKLTDALTALPGDLAHAFVRPTVRKPSSASSMDWVMKLPNIDEAHVRYNKHLLDRYVPDAHGLQVLTTQHVERIRDLSAWQVSDLGANRHLVQATDLAAWYSTTTPEPAVVDRARADFTDILLTTDAIAANPTPW